MSTHVKGWPIGATVKAVNPIVHTLSNGIMRLVIHKGSYGVVKVDGIRPHDRVWIDWSRAGIPIELLVHEDQIELTEAQTSTTRPRSIPVQLFTDLITWGREELRRCETAAQPAEVKALRKLVSTVESTADELIFLREGVVVFRDGDGGRTGGST